MVLRARSLDEEGREDGPLRMAPGEMGVRGREGCSLGHSASKTGVGVAWWSSGHGTSRTGGRGGGVVLGAWRLKDSG